MKYIFQFFLGYLLVITMLLVLCTACGSSSPDDNTSGGTSSQENYIITETGNINDPNDLTTDQISAEYNTFLVLNDYSDRKIYFGGLIPLGNYPDQVNINCSALYLTNVTDYITYYSLYGKNYYYIPFTISSNAPVSDYSMTAKLLDGQTTLEQKVFTIKVENYDARNWALDVYQQQSYNSISFTEAPLKDAFEKMLVPITVTTTSSSLTDLIVNLNNNLEHQDNPIVQYAYNIIYPNMNTLEAMATYSVIFPNSGLLFYIQNYNVVGGDDPQAQGLTYSTLWDDGVNYIGKYPALSFVFVEKIKDHTVNDWENQNITSTSIHELGHLWCTDITDEDTHEFWHNGNNKERCVMIGPYEFWTGGEPKDNTKDIFEYLEFCEGHLQRGLNVSWVLKQYKPFGETTNSGNQDLFAYDGSPEKLYNNSGGEKLEISIESMQREYIKGELIDILVEIKNNSSDTIRLSKPNQYAYSREELKTIQSAIEHPSFFVTIPPFQKYIYFLSPLHKINYKKEGMRAGYPWYYWDEGSYDYNISFKVDGTTYTSNKISLTIKPVPDSLKGAFEDLKRNIDNPRTITDGENLFNKYKGTFYEQEFFSNYLGGNYSHYQAIANPNSELRQKLVELYKEFILKYPNTYSASVFLSYIYGNRNINESLLKEISVSLNRSGKGEFLLKVLNNRKKY